MTETTLGKATLELDTNMDEFEREIRRGARSADELQRHLDQLEAQSHLAREALQSIRMEADQASKTAGVSERVKRSLAVIADDAEHAREQLERVELGEAQAAETEAAGSRIERTLNKVVRKANEARRALESARLASTGAGGAGGGGGGGRNPGGGFGGFGSGFGRVGVLGAALGGAALLAPAAGPGAAGLLATIPVLAAGATGAVGTLALAFQGVGKAIGGDLKAFKALQPAQQQFVLTVRSLTGWVHKLKETAGESLFPGLTKGLKAALSPGTLGAITKAVTQFGHAIGQAGAQWGKYFGSAQFQQIFGPLMTAGTKTLTTMSTAALSLFDAFGVLGRAAIPFTGWLTDTVAHGARFIDTFVRGKEASGALASGLDEAKVSLRLVGGLLSALAGVVGSLGRALYPVSKVAVKDLTDGLNALAGIIDRNKTKIQDIVGGALAALKSTIETLSPVAKTLAGDLDAIAQAVGGWKTAFELIIAGTIAKSLLGISFAAGEAGAAGRVALLMSRLRTLALIGGIVLTIDVLANLKEGSTGRLITEGALAGALFGSRFGVVGTVAGAAGGAAVTGGFKLGQKLFGSASDAAVHGTPAANAAAAAHPGQWVDQYGNVLTPLQAAQAFAAQGVNPASVSTPFKNPYTDLVAGAKPHAGIPASVSGSSTVPYWQMPPGYGDAMPAWTKNLGPKPPKPPKPSALDIVFPQRMQAALSDARTRAAGGTRQGLEHLLAVAKKSLDYLDAEHRTGKKLVVLNRERATVAALIASTEQKIGRIQAQIPQRIETAIGNAKAALAATSTTPADAAAANQRVIALGQVVAAERKALDYLKQQHTTGAAMAKIEKERAQHTTALNVAMAKLGVASGQAAVSTRAEQILGIGKGPTLSGQLAALQRRERSLLTRVLTHGGADASKLGGLSLSALLDKARPALSKASERSLGKIGQEFALYAVKGFLPKSAIDNIQARLQQFNDTVTGSFAHLSLSAKEIARQNERDFLSAFASIQSRFASNANPSGRGGAADTHLFDIKHENRKQTRAIEKVANRVAAQASDYVLQLGFA